ncbi:hypothetical protein H4696_003254 [Amycolatopsis lexingtonensis]|uniref:Uncharacterized protein n=1 Tax=Amycolatopsis lexingtonensis TaxID=218822 RepID=A0ABR9HYY5_9PSEU|nr:hypothetical protein [Amycolatopsis lexingtonensis]MBE1496154.1 hypothetical protein [Amycolatopsis lexingtonensis]
MLYEIESAEQRDRYVTARGEQTEAALQFWARHPEAEAVLARWRRLGTYGELPTLFTDYRLLADNPRSTVAPGPRYRDRPGEEPVARVVGIHNLALRAGVTSRTSSLRSVVAVSPG